MKRASRKSDIILDENLTCKYLASWEVWYTLIKKYVCTLFIFFGFMLASHAAVIDSITNSVFGKVNIFYPDKVPDAFVLLVSGDGGWNNKTIKMANNLVLQGAMVVGIDIRHYLKNLKLRKTTCHYPAGDFEEISLTIQKNYKIKQYLKPILVGYSSGATLAYGILAQSPANTFKGAVVLGFCPDIFINKPLCNGLGLSSRTLKEGKSYYLNPTTTLTVPFIVLNGKDDLICSYAETKSFIEKIPLAELITLPDVGHGFSNYKNWWPQFIKSYQKIMNEPGYAEIKSAQNVLLQSQHLTPYNSILPLTLIPASSKENLPLVFFISGDGGWTSFDQSVSDKLAEKGFPVVGLDAQKYFWNEKQPKEAADAIASAIIHYMQIWNRKTFVMVGYSFGACVAPFIANNFSVPVKENLKGVYCFSADETGDFEIHLTDMLSFSKKEKYNVLNELRKIKTYHPVCIFGDKEDADLKIHFQQTAVRVETLPGNHHYNDDYNALAAIIYNDFINKK